MIERRPAFPPLATSRIYFAAGVCQWFHEVVALNVNERFVSLQGEGELVGVPSSFVRVSGCNLRCAWCDTPQTSWRPTGEMTDLDELVAWCADGPRHVVITGGEPLLFAPVAELTQRLGDAGHHVTIETAGTTTLEDLHCDLMSLSPKLAHSTPTGNATWSIRHEERRRNLAALRALMVFPWQLKIVVRATSDAVLAADIEEVETLLAELHVKQAERAKVLLMPECIDQDRLRSDYARLAPVCNARGLRLGPRLHLEIFGHRPGT